MTDITLIKELEGTRRVLAEVCDELNIPLEAVGADIDRCSNCGIWSTKLIPDLDDNPICPVCYRVAGL